jgi:hypothetical protein
MDYSGPETADFANVTSLNQAFLMNLREPAGGQLLRRTMTARVQSIIRDLTDLQLQRLSAVPFMLMSLRERDVDFWQTLFSKDANGDMFDSVCVEPQTEQLATAGVAFLWQLARRNPYSARLLSGATIHWCEELADRTLLRLLQQTCGRNDLLQPRCAANDDFWFKLLGPGLSSEAQVRHAAHMAALQSILTEDPVAQYRPMQAAACNTLVPTLRVSERKD